MTIKTNKTIKLEELQAKTPTELLEFAETHEVTGAGAMRKQEMMFAILRKLSTKGIDIVGEGVIDVTEKSGYGFLRTADDNYVKSDNDIYVSQNLVKDYCIRTGDLVTGNMRAPHGEQKNWAITKILKINSEDPKRARHRIQFSDLRPLYPDERITLERDDPSIKDMSCRMIDLISPIGKGQRALITSPPKAGKTMLLQNIANSITANHPEITLIILLIDERPEEVTDMERNIKGDFELISSTFDRPPEEHIQLSNICIEKAKRLVEYGKDVVILLDSITRLGRAYNTIAPNSGRVLTGGIDSRALQQPKKFLGAARNIEDGGSLTIVATALIDTGSQGDSVIFEEYKSTGNAEIILSRHLSEKRRIFPAIDIHTSGTRREELLIPDHDLKKLLVLRKIISDMDTVKATEFLLDKMRQTKSNADFFDSMNTG